jgi:hypothetical protein
MIALVTPTGARPKQIELCAKFMRNQDYTGKVLWVLVDDAEPVTTQNISLAFRENWTIWKIFPKPVWRDGQNTQARNLISGMNEVKKFEDIEAIFIIEDDDYYCPCYLSVMMEKIKGHEVTGQVRTIYYDVVHKGWIRNGNMGHASLFQTAFTPASIHLFERVCKSRKIFIDAGFFKAMHLNKINLFEGKYLAIGIKGLPGRRGIGMGHRMDARMTADPEFAILKELIGEDYKYYL